MFILGLESSCDETACAVLEADESHRLTIRANAIASQIEIHRKFGGVVPEVASRQHLLSIIPVIEQALAEANVELSQIGAIAVTRGPGLVGALLVALQTAKALAFAKNIPLIGVHHLEGHLLAPYLQKPGELAPVPEHPCLGLLVSGGHTSLVLVRDFGEYQILGRTRDDAAGEAFDKVGKLMGLGYPAGPQIDQLAQKGTAMNLGIPKAMNLPKNGLDFSYSGLKTWMAEYLRQHGVPQRQALADLCATFQNAVVEQLVRKVRLATREVDVRSVIVSGGVACNSTLRQQLRALCDELGKPLFVPPPSLCTDNAAMIACAGYYRFIRGERMSFSANAVSNWALGTPILDASEAI